MPCANVKTPRVSVCMLGRRVGENASKWSQDLIRVFICMLRRRPGENASEWSQDLTSRVFIKGYHALY